MRTAVIWMERYQIVLYLAALGVGAAAGLLLPAADRPAGLAVAPVLGVLLYATFLGVPMAGIGSALRDRRFLAAVLALNFVAVPAVVVPLSRVVAHDSVLHVAVLLVLLTPCIDYVIVFTGLAGGSKDRLLAAAPLLMLGQLLLLPVFLRWFGAGGMAGGLDFRPFLEAFVGFIALPLAAAGVTQFAAARHRWGRRIATAATGSMVPLMAATLVLVVASQIGAVGDQLGALALAVPVFVLFAGLMIPVGALAGRVAGLDTPARRAVLFSGVTRNSLVVLPLALALPVGSELAPLVVVTQTLVELLVMVVLVRLVPRLIPQRPTPSLPGRSTDTGS